MGYHHRRIGPQTAGGDFLGRASTYVGGAVVLLVLYLVFAWIAEGYFGLKVFPDALIRDGWAAPDSWADWRDVVIVLTGVFWLLAAAAWLAAGVAAFFLFLFVRRMLKENVAPAVDSLKASLDNVKGTTEFAGETIASPLIRAYSVVRGVRGGIGAITDLPSFIKGRKNAGRKKKKK
jgi:hypothetical protein